METNPNRPLPRERRRQPKIAVNESSIAGDKSRRLQSLPRNFDSRSMGKSVERLADWVDRGIVVSINALENLLVSEPRPTSQGSTSQVSDNNADEILCGTDAQGPCKNTAQESTQVSLGMEDYVERFVDWINVGITGILGTCVGLEYDCQGSTSLVSNDNVVEIPTAATSLQNPCMTTMEASQDTVGPMLEAPVDVSPEIHESCLVEDADAAHATIAQDSFGEAPVSSCNVASEPLRDDVNDDEWIVVESEL